MLAFHSKTCPYFHQLDQLYSSKLALPPLSSKPNADRRDNSELLDAIVVSTEPASAFNFHKAAEDFGNIYKFLPSAVLHPGSVIDIASMVRHVFEAGPRSKLTIAARGHGHSLQGQTQALCGIVIHMESLKGIHTRVHTGGISYVDAPGGESWINILRKTLKQGLAPKSWTEPSPQRWGFIVEHRSSQPGVPPRVADQQCPAAGDSHRERRGANLFRSREC